MTLVIKEDDTPDHIILLEPVWFAILRPSPPYCPGHLKTDLQLLSGHSWKQDSLQKDCKSPVSTVSSLIKHVITINGSLNSALSVTYRVMLDTCLGKCFSIILKNASLVAYSNNHIALTQMSNNCSICLTSLFQSDQITSFKLWHPFVMPKNPSVRHYYSQHKIFADRMQQKFWPLDWE